MRAGFFFVIYQKKGLFHTAEERHIQTRGFAPIGMLERWNIGLRLAEPTPRREKWALGFWNVGFMAKFVISPEYSGY